MRIDSPEERAALREGLIEILAQSLHSFIPETFLPERFTTDYMRTGHMVRYHSHPLFKARVDSLAVRLMDWKDTAAAPEERGPTTEQIERVFRICVKRYEEEISASDMIYQVRAALLEDE